MKISGTTNLNGIESVHNVELTDQMTHCGHAQVHTMLVDSGQNSQSVDSELT
jgi:hypothetical protein